MKLFRYFIMIFMFFVNCIIVDASYENSYDTSVNYIESYIKDFNKYDRFLHFNDNKFGIDESGIYKDDNFIYGGFINKMEYDVIGKNASYLYDGSKYFSMTENDDKVYEIPTGYKSKNENSGLRITEYIKSRVKVLGSGTYVDPWTFTTLGVFVKYDENKGVSNIIDTISLEEGDVHYIKDYTPERENYAFSGWKLDRSEGIGTYFSGDSYEAYADTTFYAAWRKIHKVSYDLNGGSGVSTNTFDVIDGENHLIDSIVPIRAGYTFLGWSTSSSSSTASYISGKSYKINSDTVFYAVWKQNKVKINYHVNGGTVTPTTTADNGTVYNWTTSNGLVYLNGKILTKSVNYGATVDVHNYNNSKALKITRTGYTPPTDAEWICSSGCTTANKTFDHNATYNASDLCDASNGDCTVVLKVNWQANTYTVAYNANGGSGTMSSVTHTYNVSKTLTANVFKRTGYIFVGWNTKADGSGTSYANSVSVKNLSSTKDATVTLYAQWKRQYTVKYNANGGTGADSTVYKVNEGDTYTITSVVPTPSDSTNYTFAGWATSSTGSVVYKKSQSGVSVTSDLILYAVYVPYVAQVVGGSKYTSLASAISAISSSGTINLLTNMSTSENVTIPSSKTITINLNSKTAKGKITNKGSLTIKSGTYTNSGNVFVNTGTLTITNGTYTSTGNTAISNTTGNVNVNGGTITGSTYGISNTSGIVRVYGGTVTGSTYGIYGTGSKNIYVGNSSYTLSTTSPKVSGGSYGVYMSTTSLGFYFYSGVIMGTTNKPYRGSTTLRSNYEISTSKSGSNYKSILVQVEEDDEDCCDSCDAPSGCKSNCVCSFCSCSCDITCY